MPLRLRRSSSEMFSPGVEGRTKITDEPKPSICFAIEALRPATTELIPITVMMPMTTPRIVRPARSL